MNSVRSMLMRSGLVRTVLSSLHVSSALNSSFATFQQSLSKIFCANSPRLANQLVLSCNLSSTSSERTMSKYSFDLLTSTAGDVRLLLENKETTSIELVQACLDQIEAHNRAGLKLNALLSIAPREDLLRKAAILDKERQEGEIRSPLHGLPIILKVSAIVLLSSSADP